MKTIMPQKLKKGDKIALFAPSGAIKDGQIETMQKAIAELGLECYIPQQCYADIGYLAGTDEQKVETLHSLFLDESIKGIFCIRGGYGVMRYLDKLDYNLIKNNPKVFIGMSDITALQAAILKKAGLVTFSGPMSSHFNENFDFSVQAVNDALFEGASEVNLQATEVLKEGDVEGEIIAGNLAMMSFITGTQYDFDYEGSILMFEEVGEYKYAIDRFLQQMRLSGKLEKVKAIVVGENVYRYNDIFGFNFNEIVLNALEGIDMPIAVGAKFGHQKNHLVLPIGQRAKLSLKKNKSILILK